MIYLKRKIIPVILFVLSSFIITSSISLLRADDLSELEKYKQEKNNDKNKWKQERDAELDLYKERVQKERKAWQEYVNDVKSKWGEYVDSKPKAWAEYGANQNSLSIIDYENNLASLEVLIDGDDDGEAEKLFTKRFEDIMNARENESVILEKLYDYGVLGYIKTIEE